jgi:hypothetical protein
MDRLASDNLHPVQWNTAKSKSLVQKGNVVMYHREFQQLYRYPKQLNHYYQLFSLNQFFEDILITNGVRGTLM